MDPRYDVTALMVLRHFGVPTRLLDWSMSPFVAAYFAACSHDAKDGEIWTFDEPFYAEKGKEQWGLCRETIDGNGEFRAELTMFTPTEPEERCNWFVCGYYRPGFPRQDVQEGVYTLTARFGLDHANAIERLLIDPARFRRYLIPPALKAAVRTRLRKRHGIWPGSLFPDTAGAAETAAAVFENKAARR